MGFIVVDDVVVDDVVAYGVTSIFKSFWTLACRELTSFIHVSRVTDHSFVNLFFLFYHVQSALSNIIQRLNNTTVLCHFTVRKTRCYFFFFIGKMCCIR